MTGSLEGAFPHRAVQLLAFEINVRYYRFFLGNPEHLPTAIAGFLDAPEMLPSHIYAPLMGARVRPEKSQANVSVAYE